MDRHWWNIHDNPNKAHFYFYTHTPMPKKSSDAVNFDIVQKMEKDEVPAIRDERRWNSWNNVLHSIVHTRMEVITEYLV